MEGKRLLFAVLVSLYHMSGALGYSFNQSTPLVPAVIVFGDSIVDPGNNNQLETTAKCNFPPYGQNFYGHEATGRFSNGKIPTDFIAEGLGVKDLLPPYVGYKLTEQDILTGVSFASGGSGFDPLTPTMANAIPMTDQLKLFAEYKEKLNAIAGEEKAAEILSEASYIICVGTDDIANTYFTTPIRVIDYDIPSYVNLLISDASSFFKQLQAMGARKIGYVGLPPIGCVPSQRTVGGGPKRACEPKRNYAAQLYNCKIQEEFDKILKEPSFKETKITYMDIYNVMLDIIERPEVYGFEEATKGCCGTGLIEVTALCNSETATTCSDVKKYVFWDSYHPTERAYKAIVNNMLDNYLQYLI